MASICIASTPAAAARAQRRSGPAVRRAAIAAGRRAEMPLRQASMVARAGPDSSGEAPVETAPQKKEGVAGMFEAGGEMLKTIKNAGLAGTLSYGAVELGFWALAFPVALVGYHTSTGEWLDPRMEVDKATLLGAVVAITTGARIFVPARIALAASITPFVQSLLTRMRGGECVGEHCDGFDGA